MFKVTIDDNGNLLSAVRVEKKEAATHFIEDTWSYKDMSHFGMDFTTIEWLPQYYLENDTETA
jgi:hypothetical protein